MLRLIKIRSTYQGNMFNVSDKSTWRKPMTFYILRLNCSFRIGIYAESSEKYISAEIAF